eukprot:7394750-Ditylum_brightwellii.AAC.1
MPRSAKDSQSAFFHAVTTKKEAEIYAMVDPDLEDYIDHFKGLCHHYVRAYITERGGESLISRSLRPEAIMGTENYVYCLETHKLKPKDPNNPILKTSSFQLKDFDNCKNLLTSKVTILPNPEDICELGSKASRHAKQKANPKK